jgi:D-alanine transaminase
LLANVLDKQKGFEKGFFEVWQLRRNLITEGTTSNAFIVNKNNHIYTHPKNNLILGGVTRDCVVEIASKNNLKVIEKAFSIDDIKKCNEAFLTSTTLGIVPVIKIEDIIINKKKIGLITKTLMKKLEDYLNKQIYE